MFILIDDLSGDILLSVVQNIIGERFKNKKELTYDLIEKYDIGVGKTVKYTLPDEDIQYNAVIFENPKSICVNSERVGDDLYTAVARCFVEFIYKTGGQLLYKDEMKISLNAGIEI